MKDAQNLAQPTLYTPFRWNSSCAMRKFSEAIDSLKNGDVDWKEKVGSVTAAAGAKLGQAREAAKAGLEAAKASENGQKFLEATAAAGQRVGQARAAAGQRIETFKASENGQKIFEAAAAAGAKLGEVRERVGAVAAELVEAGDVAFVGDADAPLPVATPRGPLDPGWRRERGAPRAPSSARRRRRRSARRCATRWSAARPHRSPRRCAARARRSIGSKRSAAPTRGAALGRPRRRPPGRGARCRHRRPRAARRRAARGRAAAASRVAH